MILKFANFWNTHKPELVVTEYHLFSDDKGSSGVFGDEGIKTNFKTPEESMRDKFDMWRTSLEEENFDVNDDLKTMSDLGL